MLPSARVESVTVPEQEPNSTAHSYEVLGKLAEGGQTEIFLARAKGVGAVERVVVLKRLKRSVTSHVELVRQFLDEASLASQLQHPNIAQVFEVGKLGGSYFYAMEFVNGETLQSLMHHARSKKIQIPVRAVLTIAAAMAAGLHHAHERTASDGQPLGIVHGDVTPTNTLVSQEGIVKLVDFGIAKAGELGHGKVSPYASPEQSRGDALDRRSDLFALGIVLWELLTLDPLYQRENDDETKLAIEYEVPAKPSTKRYDVPPELDAMVQKLLAKAPEDRFQDADELLAAIESLAQKLSILLSTADLSRMMRLWFGTKSDLDASTTESVEPVLVSSEEIPADLAATAHSPIDDQLDAVRSAAALITARATARAGSATGRRDRPTVPPELMENPGENFEQIRDRILARARAKKETKQNQLLGVPDTDPNHVTSGAMAVGATPTLQGIGAPGSTLAGVGAPSSSTLADAGGTSTLPGAPAPAGTTTLTGIGPVTTPTLAGVAPVDNPTVPVLVPIGETSTLPGVAPVRNEPLAAAAASAPSQTSGGAKLAVLPLVSRPASGTDRHTRTTAQAPITVIEEAVRRAGIADPIDSPNGVNGSHAGAATGDAGGEARTDEPDKLVVDEDVSSSRIASGELRNQGTSGVITRNEPKVSISEEMRAVEPPRDAPTTNTVAKPGRDPAAPNVSIAPEVASGTSAMAARIDAALADEDDEDDEDEGPATAASRRSASATGASTSRESTNRASTDGTSSAAGPTTSATTNPTTNGVSTTAKSSGTSTTATAKARAATKSTSVSSNGEDSSSAAGEIRTKSHPPDAAGPLAKAARESENDVEQTERVAHARASTADIPRPRPRAPRGPAWLLPLLVGATALVLLLIVFKLRSRDDSNRTTESNQTAQTKPPHAPATPSDPNQESQPAEANQPETVQAVENNQGENVQPGETKQVEVVQPVETTQAETKQAETKQPVETKQTEAKQTETKQPVETKQAEAKQTEAKQTETKQAETKQAETKQAEKKQPVETKQNEKKQPEPELGIEELFAAGEYAKTNTACTKEIVFTPQKLMMCAEAACQTKNTALAKRWTNAIAKSERPAIIEKCRALGVELEAPPAAAPTPPSPTPTPAPPSTPPPSPPADSPPASQ